jgi:putative inorganic carbon (HCO3(-)) transporter
MDGMTGTQRFVWICLQVLVFAVPLAISNANWIPGLLPGLPGASAFGLPLTYDQFDIVKVFVMRACALAGLIGWSLHFFSRGGTLRRTKLDWLILIFLGWVLVTSLTSVSPATALFGKYRRFEGFFSFLTYAITFFLVTQMVDRPSRMRALARTLLISGCIVSGYGVLQYLGLDPISWGSKLPFEVNRGFSTYGNPDLFGGFLIFPLSISITMALSETNWKWRAFYWLTFLVTILAWITAFTRGAWLGGIAALVAIAIALWLAKPKLGAVDWSAIGLTAAASTLPVLRSLQSDNPVMNVWTRLKSIVEFGGGSSLTRFEIWQAAVDSIKARPVFGWGADTFRLVFPKFKPVEYTRDAGYLSVADNVHDYPLQLASGIGIIGFLLLYGLFGWALWLGAPAAFSRGKGVERLVVTGFWAAAIGYIGNLMTGLSVTGSSVLLWIALAVIVSSTATEHKITVKSWMPAVGVVMAAVLGACWCYNVVWVVADRYYLLGQFPQTKEQGIADLKTAISLNPFNDQYRAQLGQAYQTQLFEVLGAAGTAQKQGQDVSASMAQANGLFQLAETTFKDTIAQVPTEYDNYVFLSSLYNQVGTYVDPAYLQKAIAIADEGIVVEPNGPAIRFQKALAQWAQKDYKGVIATLKPAVDMDPAYVDPRAVYAEALMNDGQYAEAAKQFKILVTLQPDKEDFKTKLKAVEASAAAEATGTK